MIRIKLNNPTEEFSIGLYCHEIEKITINTETDEQTSEPMHRLVLGFLIFSIDIMW